MKLEGINSNPEIMEIAEGISEEYSILLSDFGGDRSALAGFIFLKLAALEYKIKELENANI